MKFLPLMSAVRRVTLGMAIVLTTGYLFILGSSVLKRMLAPGDASSDNGYGLVIAGGICWIAVCGPLVFIAWLASGSPPQE